MTRTPVTSRHEHAGETFLLRGWPAASGADTVLVIHHGLGEHGGRYESVARGVEPLGLHVWTYDLRGHGESTGARGDAGGLEELASDLEALLPVILERSGASRIVLMGHSLGAAAVGWYLATREPHPAITAVLLSAPPLFVARTPAVRVRLAAGRVLSRIAPRLALSNAIPSEGISSDPAEVQRYLTDPMVHDRLSVRLGLSVIDDGPKIAERAGRIRLPLLLWHGVEDPICDIRGSRALFAALPGPDKAFFELERCRHESHHERPELAAALFERMVGWLRPRLSSP